MIDSNQQERQSSKELIQDVSTYSECHDINVTPVSVRDKLGPYGFTEAGYKTINLTFHSRANQVNEINFVIRPNHASVSGILGKATNLGNGTVSVNFVKTTSSASLKPITYYQRWKKRSQTGKVREWDAYPSRGPTANEIAIVQSELTEQMYKESRNKLLAKY